MNDVGDDEHQCHPPLRCERIVLKHLDITVTPLTAPDVARVITESQGMSFLLNHNMHSAYLHQTDTRFAELYRHADWVVIDGAPILWLASRSSHSRLPAKYRIGSTDWIDALRTIHSARRLYLFGATEESNARAVETLRCMLPNWTIDGVNGFISHTSAVTKIRDFGPDIVLVGLGMPRQEHFLLSNMDQLPAATYATVGGAIDYIAGTSRLSPRWLGRIGLEWLWRLGTQPKRLAHRYLVEPFKLLALVAKQRTRRNWRKVVEVQPTDSGLEPRPTLNTLPNQNNIDSRLE